MLIHTHTCYTYTYRYINRRIRPYYQGWLEFCSGRAAALWRGINCADLLKRGLERDLRARLFHRRPIGSDRYVFCDPPTRVVQAGHAGHRCKSAKIGLGSPLFQVKLDGHLPMGALTTRRFSGSWGCWMQSWAIVILVNTNHINSDACYAYDEYN